MPINFAWWSCPRTASRMNGIAFKFQQRIFRRLMPLSQKWKLSSHRTEALSLLCLEEAWRRNAGPESLETKICWVDSLLIARVRAAIWHERAALTSICLLLPLSGHCSHEKLLSRAYWGQVDLHLGGSNRVRDIRGKTKFSRQWAWLPRTLIVALSRDSQQPKGMEREPAPSKAWQMGLIAITRTIRLRASSPTPELAGWEIVVLILRVNRIH